MFSLLGIDPLDEVATLVDLAGLSSVKDFFRIDTVDDDDVDDVEGGSLPSLRSWEFRSRMNSSLCFCVIGRSMSPSLDFLRSACPA